MNNGNEAQKSRSHNDCVKEVFPLCAEKFGIQSGASIVCVINEQASDPRDVSNALHSIQQSDASFHLKNYTCIVRL